MRTIAATGLGMVLTFAGQAADLPGSSDHPLIPRYEGAEIIAQETHFQDSRRGFGRHAIEGVVAGHVVGYGVGVVGEALGGERVAVDPVAAAIALSESARQLKML